MKSPTEMNIVKQYTRSVCEQIRWKKAHNMISTEIENHITDQKNAYIADGLDEVTSTEKAIEEMGDPVIVGSQLDRTHRPKIEWSMIVLTIFSLSIGLIVNFFVRSNNIPNLPELYYFYGMIKVIIIGVPCMSLAYFVDFTILGKYPKIIFFILIALMVATFPFTSELNGSKVWVLPIIGSTSMAMFTLLFPTAYAGIIYSMRNKGYLGIILCGIFYLISAFVFLSVARGFSSVFLCTITCFILLSFSIANGWFNVKRLHGLLLVFVPTVLISAMFLLNLFSRSYMSARLEAWLNPSSDPFGRGYVPTVIRDLLNGAKFFGQGSLPMRYEGNATVWLPSLNTDYLLTYLIHRIGWTALIVILIVLIAFVARGFYLCSKQKSVLGRIVAISVLLSFSMQAVNYIIGNLGFSLFATHTLPLISYGGMTNVINLFLIGIMLSVFKSGSIVRDNQTVSINRVNKFVEVVDGKIVIDLGMK